MALYIDIFNLRNNRNFVSRIEVATVVAAEMVRTEATAIPNHANRIIWAKKVFENPKREGVRMLWAVLAANKGASIAQILGAADALIQSKVDAAIDIFADGS